MVNIPLALGNHRWKFPLEVHGAKKDFAAAERLWPLLAHRPRVPARRRSAHDARGVATAFHTSRGETSVLTLNFVLLDCAPYAPWGRRRVARIEARR